jgi:hypothetical protein
MQQCAVCFQELRMVEGPKPREGRVWVSRLSIGHATGIWRTNMQLQCINCYFCGTDCAGVLGVLNAVLNVEHGSQGLTSR